MLDNMPKPRVAPAQREAIEATIRTIYAKRSAGDIEGMIAHVADDIVCFPRSTWRCSAFPTTLRGKTAVREAFLQRHINYTAEPSIIHRLLIDGDRAVVHRSTVIAERGTGQSEDCNAVDILRFRDGLVVEFSELPDGSARSRITAFPH